jgi:type IV secretory pathway VirD2 relaxase
MLRAMRLVVDTGIHAQGWSRERAIAYMLANSGMGRSDAIAEVERYIANPGQALAYKIGALAIQRLRAKAEAQLGAKLQWVAVDHHDTDNPHTHLILRGRRADGKDLILPKDFVRYAFREIARDVATEWIGPRSREDERLALEAEISRHAPTRLDRIIANQLPEDGRAQVAKLEAPNGDPVLTQAVKARAKELARLGLASEEKRRGLGARVLAFQPDWQDRLKAMELHLNVRKRLMMERTAQRQAELERAMQRLVRGVER